MLPEEFQPQKIEDAASKQRLRPSSCPQLAQGIETLAEFDRVFSPYSGGVEWWMRGEPKEYRVPGLPKFARPYVTGNASPEELELLREPIHIDARIKVFLSCMTCQEEKIIEDFRNVPRKTDRYYDKHVGPLHEGVGLLALARHRGEPTRLLDVTHDPRVALFFACQDCDDEDSEDKKPKDGFVWLYPQPVNMHGECKPADFRNTFDVGTGLAGQELIRLADEGRLHECKSVIERAPLNQLFLLKVEEPNEPMIKQKGAFLWSPKPLQALTMGAVNILVKEQAKPELLRELESLGIHREGLGLED